MRAVIYERYGPPEVLKIEDVEKPSMKDMEDRLLIKVHSASVNPYDYLFRKGYLPVRLMGGLLKPKQQKLGIDVAGTVEAVSKDVSRFKVGDRVYGNCLGSHAEYVRVRPGKISFMPKNLTFNEAAAIPVAAMTALQALRDVAHLKKGQKVLINGAAGGVGHFAVQLAKSFGAEVTAVCSTSNLAWVKALGADEVIDYTKEDFARNGRKYDVILDAAAARTYFSCKHSLIETGVYITENPLKPGSQIVQVLLSGILRDKRMKTAPLTNVTDKDLDFLRELVEAGKVKPVIDTSYPLDRIAEAHRHVENGHTKGKVVVVILKG